LHGSRLQLAAAPSPFDRTEAFGAKCEQQPSTRLMEQGHRIFICIGMIEAAVDLTESFSALELSCPISRRSRQPGHRAIPSPHQSGRRSGILYLRSEAKSGPHSWAWSQRHREQETHHLRQLLKIGVRPWRFFVGLGFSMRSVCVSCKDEARVIAHHLREKVLPNLPHTLWVLLDGSVTSAPDGATFHKSPKDFTKIMGQSVHGWRSSLPSAIRAMDFSSTGHRAPERASPPSRAGWACQSAKGAANDKPRQGSGGRSTTAAAASPRTITSLSAGIPTFGLSAKIIRSRRPSRV
jgi:hypothetical protein